MKTIFTVLFSMLSLSLVAQFQDERLYDIIDGISEERLREDVTTLANFGTRNTFSDTISNTRGIGAARRWIKTEFDKISEACNGCLEVFYHRTMVTPDMGSRVPKAAEVVNVVAILRGNRFPNSYVIMSGDIDSRASDTQDYTTDAPGANDNATGMAGTIEAARVLSKYKFDHSIVFTGLSGEEQGLFGGQFLAKYAQDNNWNIIGIINNDMIGNIQGIDGVVDNRSFRIFSEAHNPTETERERRLKRFYGGENDGESRQLARYIYKNVKTYMPEMNPMLIYRLDRFGRGGHHKPFNDLGYPGVRIMEAHENYNWQHQDIRTENGIAYGDVLEHVNFPYHKKLTAVNAINLASIAWAPPQPKNVGIGGAVQPSTRLEWNKVENAKGYVMYWRDTTSPTWQNRRYVGDVDNFTLKNIVIDNYLFGVASIGANGIESIVAYPTRVIR